MANQTIKIFIASSSELEADRDDFRIFIADENARLNPSGIFLEVVCWENFSNALAEDGLQAAYNEALCKCDMAVFLIFSKVGKYTGQEFDVAVNAFNSAKKPKIWTYFKNEALYPESIKEEEIATLFAFKQKVRDLKHYRTKYVNIYDLKYQFKIQLDLNYPDLFAPAKTIPVNTAPVATEPATPGNLKNSFNEVLTLRLFEAIKDKCDKASELVEGAEMNGIVWQTDADCRNVAKDIIAGAYIGIIGIQLRKLMAIGKEEMSQGKLDRYIGNCHLTTLRALQLLCFALLSKLWDEKDKNYVGTPDQIKILNNFFSNTLELNIVAFTKLFGMLAAIFTGAQLDYPITELKEFIASLQNDDAFMGACNKMHTIMANAGNAAFTEADCYEAENQLTIILEQLNFLVNYNMESIKNIEYYGIRNIERYYEHNFTALSPEENSNIDRDQIKVSTTPLNTYAVLLYNNKIDYQPKLNLFPFVIDANALASEKGAKIYFFASSGKDGNLNYSFWEDKDNKLTIDDPARQNANAAANVAISTSASFKAKRSMDVLMLFNDAKKVITRTEIKEAIIQSN
jgi:hypothetical protein